MTISKASNSSLYNVNQGILGVGNWSYVTATTGTPVTGTYTDANGVQWKYYQWNANGSVTLTTGLVDLFMISGGAGAFITPSVAWGRGGQFRQGIMLFSSATHSITVGAGGPSTSGSSAGKASIIGPYTTGDALSNTRGLGSLGVEATDANTPVTTSITGVSQEFGRGNQIAAARANFGDGGGTPGSTAGTGSSGTVIIRVPLAFAQI